LFIVVIALELTNQLKTIINFLMNKFDYKDFRIDKFKNFCWKKIFFVIRFKICKNIFMKN